MSLFKYQETTDLYVDDKAVITGEVISKSDICIKGNIYIDGMNCTPGQIVEEPEPRIGLLGSYNGLDFAPGNTDGPAFPVIQYYNGVTGASIGNTFPRITNEVGGNKMNMGMDKTPGYIIRIWQPYNGSQFYIVRIRISDQSCTYHPVVGLPNANYGSIAYSDTNDKYYVYNRNNQHIYIIDPTTFNTTDLTAANFGSGSGNSSQDTGMLLVGNTAFVSPTINLMTLGTRVIFWRYNRTTGNFLNQIVWNGSFIAPPEFLTFNQSVIATSIQILSATLDKANSTVWFLIGGYPYRYFGRYTSTSLSALESDLASGNFNITIQTKLFKNYLNAICWVDAI